MILIPVKNLSSAKQRLASVLDQRSRTELAKAMLHDVLEAVAKVALVTEVSLVTSDPFALSAANEFRLQVIADHGSRSETEAIETATQVCVSRGVPSTLVIPADIPLIEASEVQAILRAAPHEGSVLVPAADGRGTNAVFRSPANVFPLRFGNDSFKPHLAAAQATGKPCRLLSLPGIALDIDYPADLQELAARPAKTRTQTLARKSTAATLPLAVNE